jgi:hypothetical protein
MVQTIFYLFLLSPLGLVPLIRLFKLLPLVVPGAYFVFWMAWEYFLAHVHPELWLRADLFLIIPAQIGVFVALLTLRKRTYDSPRHQ